MSTETPAFSISDGWLGVPRVLDREVARALSDALDALWGAQGNAAGCSGEVEIKKAWFDPLARGARLRTSIDSLPPASQVVPEIDRLGLGEPLVLVAGPDRLLVTPEGRALSELIRRLLTEEPDASRIRLRWADTDALDSDLLHEYRDLVMAKLDSVIQLRTGGAPPLLPQAIGQVLLLLLNGNVGEERGLRVPPSTADQRAVDDAVAAMVSNFAERIAPSKRGRAVSAYSLYSGYAMTEARRRLGSDLTSNPIALADGSRTRVVERLITDLARRGISRRQASAGLDALIAEYEERRPQLALYGLAQGKPSDAAELRRAFLEDYDEIALRHD